MFSNNFWKQSTLYDKNGRNSSELKMKVLIAVPRLWKGYDSLTNKKLTNLY